MLETKNPKKYPENVIYDFNFTVKINGNILVIREFKVRNYNDKFRESLEAEQLMRQILSDGFNNQMGMIPELLAKQSMDDLWYKYDHNYLDSPSLTEVKEKADVITFEINKRTVGTHKETILSANLETRIHYTSFRSNDNRHKTNIVLTPILKPILELIKDTMSQKTYTLYYGDVKLNRLNKVNKRDLAKIYE